MKNGRNQIEFCAIQFLKGLDLSVNKPFVNHTIVDQPIKNLSDFFRNLSLKCRRQTQDEAMHYLLSKFNNIFNHNFYLDNPSKYNNRLKRHLNYRDILHMLFDRFPEPKTLIQAFEDSGIPEYTPFVPLLKNQRVEIINAFTCIDTKRINNSYIESRNSIIEKLLINANGFQITKEQEIEFCIV